MKNVTALFVAPLLLLFAGCVSHTGTVQLENKKVVFIGDSITHGGRYVSYIEYYLQKFNPESVYNIISVGLGSETVSGLSEKDHPFPRPCVHSRLDNILKAAKPEILFACYGMNDGIYHPQSPQRFQAFKEGYSHLIAKAKMYGVKQIVIMTPPPFDSLPVKSKTVTKGEFGYKTPYEGYNDVLKDYAGYLMGLNVDGVAVIDLNTPMVEFVKMKRKAEPAYTLSRDGIHPGSVGNLLMAQTILNGIGYQFDGINPDLAPGIDDDDFFKLVNKKRSMRSNGWLEFIGYTRGKVVKKDSVKEVEDKVKDLQIQIDSVRNK